MSRVPHTSQATTYVAIHVSHVPLTSQAATRSMWQVATYVTSATQAQAMCRMCHRCFGEVGWMPGGTREGCSTSSDTQCCKSHR